MTQLTAAHLAYQNVRKFITAERAMRERVFRDNMPKLIIKIAEADDALASLDILLQASTPASPPAPGSAGDAAASTLSEMIAAAAWKARQPAPVANLLYSSLEWYAARPATRPTPLIVSLWINQTGNLIHQYQDLVCHLIEMQVDTIDRRSQANRTPSVEEDCIQ